MAFVKFNKSYAYKCCFEEGAFLRLVQGINDVKDELLEKALKNPMFRRRIDQGSIEIISERKAVKEVDDPNLEIQLMIPEIFDEEILQNYIDKSDDKGVIKAAKKQLKKIKPVVGKERVNLPDGTCIEATIQ